MTKNVSLIELLRNVPENARLIVDSGDGISSTYHPVGYLCHEAAKALEQTSVAELNNEYLRDTYVEGLSSAQEPVAFCKHGVPKGVCRLGEKDCD
jgi:hypothetical protein